MIIHKTPKRHTLLKISQKYKKGYPLLSTCDTLFATEPVTPLGNTYHDGSHVGTAGWSTIQMPKENLH
jgi:hypothetical protein